MSAVASNHNFLRSIAMCKYPLGTSQTHYNYRTALTQFKKMFVLARYATPFICRILNLKKLTHPTESRSGQHRRDERNSHPKSELSRLQPRIAMGAKGGIVSFIHDTEIGIDNLIRKSSCIARMFEVWLSTGIKPDWTESNLEMSAPTQIIC